MLRHQATTASGLAAVRVLRSLLRGLHGQLLLPEGGLLLLGEPTPAARALPGYLRAFSAEAATQQQPGAALAAPEAAAAAASAAQPLQQLVATLGAAAAVKANGAGGSGIILGAEDEVLTAEFEALGQFRQEQEEAERLGIHAAQPRLSPTLQAMSYHQRLMDGGWGGWGMPGRWVYCLA